MAANQQLTIRELMALVLFAAMGLAGLSAGGVVASIVMSAAIVITTALAIVAFVGRAQYRSFAIGFLIPVVTYSATLLSIGKSELDPENGMLPTTKLIKPVFELLVNREYVNFLTNQPVPDYDPTAHFDLSVGGVGGMGGMGATPIGIRETPDRQTFMSLAHVLLAMMFGYMGAKFAVWVDRRQTPRPD